MQNQITNEVAIDHDVPTEADKNLYLMMANRRFLKDFLMPNIKTIRAAYGDQTTKKLIDNISKTNIDAYNALTAFYVFLTRQVGWTEGQKETLRRVEELYMDCAILPYVTPSDQMDDLGAMIDNFKSGMYTIAGGEVVDALQSAPDNYNEQVYMIIHTFFPDADSARKRTLANSLEKLSHLRKATGL